MLRMSVATYNVHQWIGADGRRDPKRVLDVVRELEVQIMALQEVTYLREDSWEPGKEFLESTSGMRAVTGPTLRRGPHHFGNVILVSYPLLRVDRLDISICGREPRGV